MNFLIFAFERSIVFTTVGLLAALALKVILGKTLIKKFPVLWRRALIYSAISAVGIVFDYSNAWEEEFNDLPSPMHITMYVTSFVWSFLLIFPVAYVASIRKVSGSESTAQKSSDEDKST